MNYRLPLAAALGLILASAAMAPAQADSLRVGIGVNDRDNRDRGRDNDRDNDRDNNWRNNEPRGHAYGHRHRSRSYNYYYRGYYYQEPQVIYVPQPAPPPVVLTPADISYRGRTLVDSRGYRYGYVRDVIVYNDRPYAVIDTGSRVKLVETYRLQRTQYDDRVTIAGLTAAFIAALADYNY